MIGARTRMDLHRYKRRTTLADVLVAIGECVLAVAAVGGMALLGVAMADALTGYDTIACWARGCK